MNKTDIYRHAAVYADALKSAETLRCVGASRVSSEAVKAALLPLITGAEAVAEMLRKEMLSAIGRYAKTEAPEFLTLFPWEKRPEMYGNIVCYWRMWAHEKEVPIIEVYQNLNQWRWEVSTVDNGEDVYAEGVAETLAEAQAAADAAWDRYLAEIAAASAE